LVRRHPNGESEGIWNGPIFLVKPELRKGYDRHPRNIGSSGESMLRQRKFPVSSEGVAFSRIGVLVKQLRFWRKEMGVWREREKERERTGWEGAKSVPEVHLMCTKMLGKPPLTKAAHEKSLTSKNKV
jgi:hypothetical protein